MSPAEDGVDRWLTLPGRLSVRIHLGVPLLAAGLAAARHDLWLRYLLLLGVLLLHELAHAAVSLALGGHRAVVRLWPVFGRADVAAFEDRREALAAAAGPAANLAAAAVFLLLGGRLTLALGRAPLLDLLATANLLMGAGNLLPLPFCDGGRVLRAIRQRRG